MDHETPSIPIDVLVDQDDTIANIEIDPDLLISFFIYIDKYEDQCKFANIF